MNKRNSFYLFTITAVSLIAVSVLYYPKLPDSVAAHFNFKGDADGWMNKKSFFFFQLGLSFFFYSLFLVISYLLPRINNSLLNLPNKDYWLNEEKREMSLSKISTLLYQIGSAVNIFFVLVFNEIYKANLNQTDEIGSGIWIYLAALIILTMVLIVKHIRYFNNINQL